MKPAEDGPCIDLAELLDGRNQRRILGQRQMRPNMVVVGSIGLEDLAQMVLAEDHDVIQALEAPLVGPGSLWQQGVALRLGRSEHRGHE
jgi:hypothetical protein